MAAVLKKQLQAWKIKQSTELDKKCNKIKLFLELKSVRSVVK